MTEVRKVSGIGIQGHFIRKAVKVLALNEKKNFGVTFEVGLS